MNNEETFDIRQYLSDQLKKISQEEQILDSRKRNDTTHGMDSWYTNYKKFWKSEEVEEKEKAPQKICWHRTLCWRIWCISFENSKNSKRKKVYEFMKRNSPCTIGLFYKDHNKSEKMEENERTTNEICWETTFSWAIYMLPDEKKKSVCEFIDTL